MASEQQGAWGTKDDPLYDQAVALVRKYNRPSISLVQRHLQIGWNRANGLIDAMVGSVITDMPPVGKVMPHPSRAAEGREPSTPKVQQPAKPSRCSPVCPGCVNAPCPLLGAPRPPGYNPKG